MYKLIADSTSIIRLADKATVPAYPDNMAYVTYLEWLAVGNTPLPAQTLAEIKADKIGKLTAIRDAETVKDVTAHARLWQSDERSQKLLSSAITLASAGLPLPPVWRDTLNNDMPIVTIADLLAIAGAMAVQTQNAYTKSCTLKAQIEAAITQIEVEAINW